MTNKNIVEYWKKTRIKKGEVRNKTWQPRKWISYVNEELNKAGYSPATKQDIEVNYMSMLQLPQSELMKLWNDNDKPMLIRILAKNILWWKGFEIIEKMLDRWIGKANQSIEHSVEEWTQIIFWIPKSQFINVDKKTTKKIEDKTE